MTKTEASKSAHTPGPWLISYHHEGGTQIAIDDEPGMQGERDYDLATVTHGDPDELEANARLIAAAPELLEALIRCEACTTNDEVGRQARAAIAKALGETT